MVNHYPHLCLVEDWLDNDFIMKERLHRKKLKREDIVDALNVMKTPAALKDPRFRRALEGILYLQPDDMWAIVPIFLSKLQLILADKEYRQVSEVYKKVWFRLNHFFPRPLWVQTVNTLLANRGQTNTQEQLVENPLCILRVDMDVFFCAPMVEILLRILRCYLSACRATLLKKGTAADEEIHAVTLGMESAAVQILLEVCLFVDEDGKNPMQARETRSLICSYLHQVYQADTRILKMVHYQGYDLRLLPVVVRGVPSMHCCLDFIHELMNMGEIKKQTFAICLLAEITAQYSLTRG
ncbi:unnamed protein product, partial [Cyprideis torosa]